MFKKLYNSILFLNINHKSNQSVNLYSFLKKSTLIKNYSNYLNYCIAVFGSLKLKTIQTSTFRFNFDDFLTTLYAIAAIWLVVELFVIFLC